MSSGFQTCSHRGCWPQSRSTYLVQSLRGLHTLHLSAAKTAVQLGGLRGALLVSRRKKELAQRCIFWHFLLRCWSWCNIPPTWCPHLQVGALPIGCRWVVGPAVCQPITTHSWGWVDPTAPLPRCTEGGGVGWREPTEFCCQGFLLLCPSNKNCSHWEQSRGCVCPKMLMNVNTISSQMLLSWALGKKKIKTFLIFHLKLSQIWGQNYTICFYVGRFPQMSSSEEVSAQM